MPRKRKPFDVKTEDLDLMPIMGLMVVLIPMLLMITVFVNIGVINVSAPKVGVGSASEADPDEKKPLNLTIGISEKGFTLAATGGVLPGEEAKAAAPEGAESQEGPTIPVIVAGGCDDGSKPDEKPCGDGNVCPGQCGDGNICKDRRCVTWNFPALYSRMVEIKEAYPNEAVVNVGADDTVHYGTLVATMDAVRRRRTEDKYTSADEFEKAKFKQDDEGRPVSLFSDVVLAVIQ